MNVKPLREFVAVSKAEQENKTPPGLLVSTLTDKMVRGTVLAVGSGKVTANGSIVPVEVQIGDQVVFNSSLATEIKADDGPVFLLREENIVAVITK
jgi:chaperonin GroES